MFGGEAVWDDVVTGLCPDAATLYGIDVVSTGSSALTTMLSGPLAHRPADSSRQTTFLRHSRGNAIVGVTRRRFPNRGVHGAFFRLRYSAPSELAVTVASVGVYDPSWLVGGARAYGMDTFLLATQGGTRIEITAPSGKDDGPLDADEYIGEHLTASGREAVLTRAHGGDDSLAAPRLTRVALHVHDVRAAVSFFEAGLGFGPVRTHPHGVLLSNGNQDIDIVATRRSVHGLAGLGFYIDDADKLTALTEMAPSRFEHNRPMSVQVAGPEGVKVTLHLGDGTDRAALLRETTAHYVAR